MQRVLSLDLDFFLDRVHLDGGSVRLDPEKFHPWSEAQLRNFLSRLPQPAPGSAHFATHHDACFHWWQRLITDDKLTPPFEVVHIDAHADLGLGDDSHYEIMGRLMFLPPEQRAAAITKLDEGNFLAYAAACGWIGSLTYVTHPSWHGRDLNFLHFLDYDDRSGFMEFKRITMDRLEKYLPKHEYYIRPYEAEAPIPFRSIMGDVYTETQPFDFVFLCQSPEYTPPTADALLRVLKNWAHVETE